MGKGLAVLFVWGFLVTLFYQFVISAWPHVVSSDNRNVLLAILLVMTGTIFFCSLMETAVSSDNAYNFGKWANGQKKKNAFRKWRQNKAIEALKHRERVNSVIVMLNTVLTVLISVATLTYVVDSKTYKIWGCNAADGFTVIGVTLLIFVVGETIPKQIAMRYPHQVLLIFGFIPGGLAVNPVCGWISLGLTAPFVILIPTPDGSEHPTAND